MQRDTNGFGRAFHVMRRLRVLACLLVALAGCGDNAHDPDYLGYSWDDRRVVCGHSIDDLTHHIDVGFIDHQLDEAAAGKWVTILYAHVPTGTVSLAMLDRVLSDAEARGLQFYTFRDLGPSPTPRGGLAMTFDDNSPDQWLLARDVLARHGAHATFFVAHWNEMTPLQHQEIGVLHDDGDDIEPHTLHHLHALAYVAEHGMDAYLNDEVLPSFQVLIDAGYPPPNAFAYPFGEHSPAIDDAVLQHVWFVRTTPGECPWAGWSR